MSTDLATCAGSTEKLQQQKKSHRVKPLPLKPRAVQMNLLRQLLPMPDTPAVAADSALAPILASVPAFLSDDSQEMLALPATLGAKERAVVHSFAGHLALGHDSVGAGDQRHIELRKTDSASSKVSVTGHIGLTGDLVQAVQSVCQAQVPANLVANQRDRDRDSHITLITPVELKALEAQGQTRSDIMAQFEGLEDSWQPVGIGRVENSSDQAIFVVVRWPELQQLRSRFGLGEKDAHITLGFDAEDVHDMLKDESTIFDEVPQSLVECFSSSAAASEE